jgi:uncharacterized protein
VDSSGTGSFDRVFQRIRILQEVGIDFGVLCVLNDQTVKYPDLIFRFFVDNDIYSFDFLPCLRKIQTGRFASFSITPQEYANFMIRLFDLWITKDNPKIKIRSFTNILTGILGGQPSLCKFRGNCDEFITIEANGDVFPCDDFPLIEEFLLGNLQKQSLFEILTGKKYQTFSEQVNQKPEVCQKCEFDFICKGGCSRYRYMMRNRFTDRNYFCSAQKRIFSHVLRSTHQILKNALNNEFQENGY